MMRSLVTCAVIALAAAAKAPTTRKRGFSGFLGDYWTCDDAKALDLQDAWYYAWDVGSNQAVQKCGGVNLTGEFVPMIIGAWKAKKMNVTELKEKWANANVHYLLGYNEPDYGNGHNHPHMVTPALAAVDWQEVQKLAKQFDPPLTLVSPAVASNGETGTHDAWDENGKSQWLDDFFGNCTNVTKWCQPELIKYIAMHDYHGNLTRLKSQISGAAKRYGRKVWLTEFAITKWGAPPNRDKQDAFMKEALPFLESSPDVFRYNWFSARNVPNAQNGGSNLLPSDSDSTKPTSTGAIYSTRETSVIV